jgi:hypothetical protein
MLLQTNQPFMPLLPKRNKNILLCQSCHFCHTGQALRIFIFGSNGSGKSSPHSKGIAKPTQSLLKGYKKATTEKHLKTQKRPSFPPAVSLPGFVQTNNAGQQNKHCALYL